LSSSLRRRQGSAFGADAFRADGLDRAFNEPTPGSYVMAPLGDSVECGAARQDVDHASVSASRISIAQCRELLGDEADSMTDHDVREICRHAEALAYIVIDLYQKHRKIRE
jgi:hypothetical protein